MSTYVPRTPWPANFPDVIIHNDLHTRNAHPTYKKAKAGDITAAQQLVDDLLSPDSVKEIAQLIGSRQPFVVPAAALEVGGFNAIPDAMAQALAAALSLQMASYDIGQSNYVAHTRANGWHRLVTPATFTGTIIQGSDYFLVDDHVGFGGTLANLRGYIEVNGGHVIGMTTLTETGGGRKIAARPETLFMLQEKHGNELNYTSGNKSSATAQTASQTLRQDTYIVLNPLPPSVLEWLKQQRLLVAKAYQRSGSVQNPDPH